MSASSLVLAVTLLLSPSALAEAQLDDPPRPTLSLPVGDPPALAVN